MPSARHCGPWSTQDMDSRHFIQLGVARESFGVLIVLIWGSVRGEVVLLLNKRWGERLLLGRGVLLLRNKTLASRDGRRFYWTRKLKSRVLVAWLFM